ncbi:hypothetical protein LIER_04779 [Lithospermum erythrorhizon]|uniref:Uncharacterized protein n=1 Tax=Lithospermum erythrorhizon TaxID=34254 RepID=A0AAV3P0P9_LITER
MGTRAREEVLATFGCKTSEYDELSHLKIVSVSLSFTMPLESSMFVYFFPTIHCLEMELRIILGGKV